MPYYALKAPSDRFNDNIGTLYLTVKYKRFYLGTFYVVRNGYYGPIFKMPPDLADRRIFFPISDEALRDSYEMVCLRGCGYCCDKNAGSFALENEVRSLPLDPRELPVKTVRTYVGELTLPLLN